MIEVTDEMLQVARSMKSFESMIKHIIELHEANKPKPEPVGYAWIVGDQIQKLSDTKLNASFVPLYTTTPAQEPLSNNMEPCDICNKEVGYHVKHFSSEDDPHIHVCDDCIKNLGLEIYLVPPVSMLKESLDLQNSNK